MEEWKDIEGFEGYYQVSNQGRIKSLPRKWAGTKERLLKLNEDNYGYYYVIFVKDGKRKRYLVHRVVAKAFIPNPLNLPCVNHKNENKKDNRVENLEWCTAEYNYYYGTRIERVAEKQFNRKDVSKPVNQYTLEGEFVKQYPSLGEAARQTGAFKTNISGCCRVGKPKSAGGFKWEYALDTP